MGNNHSRGSQVKYALPGSSSPGRAVNAIKSEEDAVNATANGVGGGVSKSPTTAEPTETKNCTDKNVKAAPHANGNGSSAVVTKKGLVAKVRKGSLDRIFGRNQNNNKNHQQTKRHHSNPTPAASVGNGIPISTVSPVRTCAQTAHHTSLRMTGNLERFAKILSQMSGSKGQSSGMIKREIFQRYVVPHSRIAVDYLWNFFCGYADLDTINEAAFVRSAEQIFGLITDKDQVQFYVKVYGRGHDSVDRDAFMDFLISAYQLSSPVACKTGRDLNKDHSFVGKEWLESVTKSCFHIKDVMSVFFLSNWVLSNVPRMLIQMHKCILHQLTTGYAVVAAENNKGTANLGLEIERRMTNSFLVDSAGLGTRETNKTESDFNNGIDPILLWILSCSLPASYVTVLQEKKLDPALHAPIVNSKQLLMQLMNTTAESQKWTLLYEGNEQGLSINRFQFHVFNYRGPTLMFITAESNYHFLVASDTEWKESCHFWGSEEAQLIQLQPEFHIVEKGPKILYANFSIRGYPFGIQVGKDPRNVSLEIKPDFEYASFKKIPCRILNFVVWGCAPSHTKHAQEEFKKWEAKQCEKQRKINLNSVDWSDNPDKYLLELAGNYKSYGSKQNQ